MSIRLFALSSALLLFALGGLETFAQPGGNAGSFSGVGGGFGNSGFGRSGGLGGNSSSFNQSGGFSTNEQFQNAGETEFVGRSAEDAEAFFNNIAQRQQQQFLQSLGLQPINNNNRNRTNQQPPQVRITLRVAFDHPTRSAALVSAGVKAKFVRSLKGRVISPSVVVTNRTATLRGFVKSAHDKLLAEKLVLLEPGVSKVENLLQVLKPF